MPTFIIISRHSPENCPMFHEKAKKLWVEYIGESEELFKKHGLRRLGGWVVPSEHLSIGVFEAPNLEAFQGFMMDPVCLPFSAYETMEVKLAFSMEEAGQMLQAL